MTKQNNNPWDEKWKIIEQIGQGGQGKTFLIERKNLVDSSERYVLKQLNKQNDLRSRKRMHREVSALKTLDYPGIARLVDSNTENFKDFSIPLYMVTEFAPGMTLHKFVRDKNLNVIEAVYLVDRLLSILDKCHKYDIIHRDIKPNNIIIRNGDIKDPVLIDFGISFNQSDLEDTDLTESWEQVGNRFLTLPEQQSKSSLQRDPRSDITQCCGILFFTLTKLNPINLGDEEKRKPHQRPEGKESLARLSSNLLAKVNRIFDRAFEHPIDYRWQSIPPLKESLMQCVQPVQSEGTNDSANDIARIREKLSTSPDYAMRQSFQSLANQIVQEIHKVGSTVARELGSEFGTIKDVSTLTGFNDKKVKINWSKLTFSHQYGISIKFIEERFFPQFKGIATGNELVLLAEFKSKETEFLRVALNGELDLTEFSERLKDFYIKGVLSIVEEGAGK